MTLYLIDSNIFLELLLDRKQADECEELLDAIKNTALSAICTQFSVHSICIYMVKEKKNKEAKNFLNYVLSLANLEVISTSTEDAVKIMEVIETTGLDFDDALQYYAAKETLCHAIITFDSDFKKTDVKTFTPKEVIETISLSEQKQ